MVMGLRIAASVAADMQQASSSCVLPPPESEAGESSERQLAERLRVQELLQYFLPLHNSTPAGQNKPRVSTDPSLTAFAQLCALKLDCQRSFISLIDDKQQYIIAEATRSTWLRSAEYTGGDDDALSFGQASLDLWSGVCPTTISCFTSPDDSLNISSDYVKASRSYYVMNDMSQLESYKNRPYIAGWPFMRYYAEVPLVSPSGYVIGSLCVVDNKRRDGLDSRGIRVLEEVASTVMDHLELCSIRVQRNRAERMIQALGQFSEGNNTVREWWMKDQASKIPEPAFRNLSMEERVDADFGSMSGSGAQDSPQFRSLNNIQEPQRQPSVSGQTAEANPNPLQKEPSSDSTPTVSASGSISTGDNNTTPLTAPSTSGVSTSSKDVQDPPHHSPSIPKQSDNNHDMLSRATNLMREGIGSSGVVLLDPRTIDDHFVSGYDLDSEENTSKMFPILPGYRSRTMFSKQVGSREFARVISCSTKSGNASDMIQIPARTLVILLAQFPSGGVISFDNRGILKATTLTSVWGDQMPSPGEPRLDPYFTQEDGSIISQSDISEIREITDALPGVTSLISFPLWDAARNKWFSYGLAWTTDPTRVFGRQDFGYLNTFVNSITVELSRIEVMADNQAKSTFVSSISHELRSPLHGIMATLEVLRGLVSDPICDDELATLEHCGSTLLDTIDNVLSFTKTNISTSKSTNEITTSNSTHVVNLGLLVEEIVSISLSGNQFRELQDFSIHPDGDAIKGPSHEKWLSAPVTVIFDLAPGHDWLFETDRASWKRVLLNLVGNSLKYTSSGFIIIKLEQEDNMQSVVPFQDTSKPVSKGTDDKIYSQHKFRERKIILSVKDSGKGMSQDYLNNFLFKPFYQEDSMAPGTGLGLSIVSQLVSSLGGEINVVSELGHGTEITITATLRSPLKEDGFTTNVTFPTALLNLKLGLSGFDATVEQGSTNGIVPATTKSNQALRSAIINSATSVGLSVVTIDLMEPSTFDILVIPEYRYRQLSRLQIESLQKPILLLSSQIFKIKESKQMGHPNVVLLLEPFGPTRFHQALKSCLRVQKSLTNLQSGNQSNTTISSPIPTRFPVRQPSPVADAILQNAQDAPKILLVEDNPINLKLLVMCVKQLKQSFLTAVDGSLAVEAYRKYSSSIELVLMDVQMPIMDGLEACRQIRRIEKSFGSSPAFITALTALSSLDAKETALESGIDFFLTKPVSMKRLKELVKQHCSPVAVT